MFLNCLSGLSPVSSWPLHHGHLLCAPQAEGSRDLSPGGGGWVCPLLALCTMPLLMRAEGPLDFQAAHSAEEGLRLTTVTPYSAWGWGGRGCG